ncbi:unnamed protein product [Linum tenue]|uniref:Elongator complex protein 4 n=1 Tax=Linum tenue TaxID=586396 RepID=A0AAV0MDX2_9ROSI|nr:unnamed protein product [Linum tenue]
MAATKTRTSSFSRNLPAASSAQSPEIKCGPNGTFFVSSGIPDLDKTLGGGIPLGSLVMVMEDSEAPHHMLLLRNFMSQGLVHKQPLLYASPSKDPRGFLDNKQDFSNEFDLRRPLDRHFYTTQHVDCISTHDLPNLAPLQERCTSFLSHFPRYSVNFLTIF